jgi:hypothetical protein
MVSALLMCVCRIYAQTPLCFYNFGNNGSNRPRRFTYRYHCPARFEREESRKSNRGNQKSCINNLRQIDQAIQLWAAETKALPTDVVTHTNLIPYLRKMPTCPSVKGGTFLSDYGMTFVEESSYCVANFSLASTPHSLVSDQASVIAIGDHPQNVTTENFPKPRKGSLKR